MPEKIGHYVIDSQLGRGGMGIVYKAKEESLNRFVAIKVLTEQLTESSTFLQRFVREAQAAAGLSHPNIVPIFFIGEDQGRPYFVMEYVSGRSLNRIIRDEGRMTPTRAAQVILQAAHGLAAAHDRGIIHRDIKPANLMLDENGMVRIADFGLALPVDEVTRLTATGTLMGTAGYLAPEQCRGEKVDQRTDVYALGVTFYELLSGNLPFQGESPLALLKQILDEEPPDVGALNPEIDADIRRILQKMIAKDRAQRYQSCHEIVTDLEDYLAARGVRSMTAGLATRKQTTARGVAADAATAILSTTNPDAPTMNLSAPANIPAQVTAPDVRFAEPVTIVQAAAAAPPPATPQRSSSSTKLVVAIVLVLLVGGSAAAFLGIKLLGGMGILGSKPAVEASVAPAPAPSTSTVANPPAEVLLAQSLTNPDVAPAVQPSQTDSVSAAPSQMSVATGTPTPTVSSVKGAPAAAAARTPSTAAAPPPAATPKARTLSGVGIAVTGDAGLTGAVSNVLMSELEAAGLTVTDAESLPSTENLVRGGDASAGRLIDRLRSEGLAHLVLARVDPSGQRELSYMGRYETAYSARITLTTYDLATGKPIGSRASGTIEYTSRTADRESEKVVGKLARAVAAAIENR